MRVDNCNASAALLGSVSIKYFAVIASRSFSLTRSTSEYAFLMPPELVRIR